MSEKTVQIIFRGSEEYRRKLQFEALRRGMKVQELIETAVNEFLAKEQLAPARQTGSPATEIMFEFNRLMQYLLQASADLDRRYKRMLDAQDCATPSSESDSTEGR